MKPGKRILKHNKLKIITIMKMQRKTTQMKEQARNTVLNIYEERIGKLLEKEFIKTIVKMIKTL